MAALTVNQISATGLTDALVAAAGGGDTFVNDGRTFLEVLNGSGGSINVTFTTPALVQGIAVSDPVVAVGAGVRKKIGPFPTELFNDANGAVGVAYSAVTTVTVGAFKL
jgi:hypothetical protein